MNHKYCDSCGQQVMSSMRICPACGNRSFSASPLQPKLIDTTLTPSPSPSSSPKLSQNLMSAGNGPRIIAWFIDFAILMVVGFILLIPIGLITDSLSEEAKLWMGGLFWIFLFLIPCLYSSYFHSSKHQATFGKRAVGIVIVTLDGNRLSFSRSFGRALTPLLLSIVGYVLLFVGAGGTRLIFKGEYGSALITSFILVGLSAIWMGPFITVFFSEKRQTLFDMICKTRVVNKAGAIR